MSDLLDRPELALAAALVVTLAWLALFYWHRVRPVGDDVGARLDALQPTALTEVARTDRYARFERRDYSGDRGAVPARTVGPLPMPIMPNVFDTLCQELGLRLRAEC